MLKSITASWVAPAILIAIALVALVTVLMVSAMHSPQSDRSGTVQAKRAYPETTELVPMYDPTLHMVVNHAIVSGPDWALTVRRPGGQTIKVWVRRTVYEACRVGDWYDSARRVCRP
jgi:hypothetical protein